MHHMCVLQSWYLSANTMLSPVQIKFIHSHYGVSPKVHTIDAEVFGAVRARAIIYRATIMFFNWKEWKLVKQWVYILIYVTNKPGVMDIHWEKVSLQKRNIWTMEWFSVNDQCDRKEASLVRDYSWHHHFYSKSELSEGLVTSEWNDSMVEDMVKYGPMTSKLDDKSLHINWTTQVFFWQFSSSSKSW